MNVINIASRLELLVDEYIIETMTDVALKLHEPQKMSLQANPILGGYMTVIKDGGIFRAYYRGHRPDYHGPTGNDGTPREVYRYVESRDGVSWERPALGIFEIDGSKENNVVLTEPPFCHNFAPMLDHRPGVPAEERYKALAGLHQREYEKLRKLLPDEERYRPIIGVDPGGLWSFVSADGIRWRKWSREPVIRLEGYGFDSQNVSFWSEHEGCYVTYFRSWTTGDSRLRTISRATSSDYIQWNEPVALDPNEPGEHLYTSQTHPYVRAPHIYVATPTRFAGDERGAATDIVFMTARGNARYERRFKSAWIRPGLDPVRWGNRSNYMAYNIVPTSSEELSIYHCISGHRYVLRTDGFVSANASEKGGVLLTKPLLFTGSRLVINYSTAAAGSVQVEIQDADGAPIPGYALADCPPVWGDAIEHTVVWKEGSDVGRLAGRPVRLRFVMKEADLYSLRFSEASSPA